MPAKPKYQPVPTGEGASDDQKIEASSKWILIWRVANVVMIVFFLLCAYVQINDPDPLIWIPVYVVPAILCLGIVILPSITENKIWQITCVIVLGVSLVLGIYTTVLLAEFIALENPLKYEEGRELAGLVIIVFWMAVCRFTAFGSTNPGKGAAKSLLLITCIIALLPLVMWSMCFIDGLAHFGHCKDMFPGMLSSFKHEIQH